MKKNKKEERVACMIKHSTLKLASENKNCKMSRSGVETK